MSAYHPDNLSAILALRAAAEPDKVIAIFVQNDVETLHLTYGHIERRARAVAHHLRARTQPGDRALLLFGPGLDYLPAFFGALYAGLIAVPVMPPPPGQPPTVLAAVAADSAASVVLTHSPLLRYLEPHLTQQPALAAQPWVAIDQLPDAPAPAPRVPLARDDVALLLYTSGSTSEPKGVMLTHANVLTVLAFTSRMADRYRSEYNVTQAGFVGWMPLYHISGLLSSCLTPMDLNYPVAILSAQEVIQRPIAWLRAMSRYRAPSGGGPNFIFQAAVTHVTPAEREGLDLSAWRFAAATAEANRASTLRQFAETYAPYGFRAATLLPAYGLSEATGAVSSGGLMDNPVSVSTFDRQALEQNQVVPAASGAPGSVEVVSSGTVIPDTQVLIVDPETRMVCPPDRVGEIWVAGPRVAKGYWNKPEATAYAFNAHTADTGQGPFLRTGDMGFMLNGELYVSGRLKEMIILRGHNYYPQDIEAAAAGAHPDLGPAGAAFGLPGEADEQIVLFHEVRPGLAEPNVDEISKAIRRQVGDRLNLPLHAVVLVAHNTLPRTASGKIRRYLCRQEFLASQAAA